MNAITTTSRPDCKTGPIVAAVTHAIADDAESYWHYLVKNYQRTGASDNHEECLQRDWGVKGGSA